MTYCCQPTYKKEALGKQAIIESVIYSVVRKNVLLTINMKLHLLSRKQPRWVNSHAKFVAKTAAIFRATALNYRYIFKISAFFSIFHHLLWLTV